MKKYVECMKKKIYFHKKLYIKLLHKIHYLNLSFSIVIFDVTKDKVYII